MNNRRRTIRIKAKFQDKIVWESVLFIFVFINILIMASFFFMKSVEDISVLRFNFAVSLVVGELCGLVLVYYLSLKASHRIAGPIYSLEKHLVRLGNGDLTTRIKLRKDDHLQDTTNIFNDAIDGLREKIIRIKNTIQELRQSNQLDQNTANLLDTLEQQVCALKTDPETVEFVHNKESSPTLSVIKDQQALSES